MKPTSHHHKPYYTVGEEIANSVTHGLGTLLSLAGLVVLIVMAVVKGTVWHVVSFSIFGGTLLLLYLSSTLYHSLSHPGAKRVFRIFDHAAIYLLIAGSYTPFMLVTVKGVWGWLVCITIWLCAIVGVILKSVCIAKFKKLTMALYVGMGWLCVVVLNDLIHELPRLSLLFLVLGGLSYTFGLIFYGWRKLPYSHAIWHLFVLSGSACHYFSILYAA